MPLLRIDVIEGRSEAELKALLDAVHGATLAAFKVPDRDRYQIVHEHPAAEMRSRIRDWAYRVASASSWCR